MSAIISDIRASLESAKIQDISADERLVFTWITDRYGIRTLELIRRAATWVPENTPEKNRNDFLRRYSGLSEVIVNSLVRDLSESGLKSYLWESEAQVLNRQQLLITTQTQCLNGCTYKQGKKKGIRRTLEWHREPTEVTIYSHTGEYYTGHHLTLRCQSCESRFNYATWMNSESKYYSFYAEPRQLILVTRKVFFTRRLAEHLQNSIVFSHCTFEAYALIMQRTHGWPDRFTGKIVAIAHRKHQLQSELRENGKADYKFICGKPINQCLPTVLRRVFSTIYPHDCTDACRMKGCDKLAVVDGMWKIGFRHCAAKVVNKIDDFPLINYPGVCTNQTLGNSKFCKDHHHLEGKPTVHGDAAGSLSEILVSRTFDSPADIDKMLSAATDWSEVTDTGCPKFDPNEMCHKNKGEGERGITYSRGYVYVVRGSGIIDFFAPIYRAESLGQVFLILVSWLYQRLQKVPENEWGELFLAYDNMCQLNRLRATKSPLPLPAPYNTMWSRISKIIDGLHISNHKNPSCRTMYGPEHFRERHGESCEQNTMAAEQTFSGIVKCKKQANSMRKDLQNFYLHRNNLHHNSYVEHCINSGKKIIGPGRRAFTERKI